MGINPLAPSLTVIDPETGQGRVNYLGAGQPETLWKPTPGMWFTMQPREVFYALVSEYEKNPTPSQEDLERIAKVVDAPGPAQVKTFFENFKMRCVEVGGN